MQSFDFLLPIFNISNSLCPAVCAKQSPGGEEHAAAEPSAGLRSAAGPSGYEDC